MKKTDVLAFAERAEEHLLNLARDLAKGTYTHGAYRRFIVHDPKRREIAKAPVRGRVFHHAAVRILAPGFERGFIFDSYSSRTGKGTHAAGKRFRKFAWRLSRNDTKTVYALQLDVRRFFDSVDHHILSSLLQRRIVDERTIRLLEIVINSFEVRPGKGIPLGNLTSQLFSNVYLDPLDQYAKRALRAKYYIRYADDITILSCDPAYLVRCRADIERFLVDTLSLELRPEKTSISKWHQGVDVLGYVHFPHHAIVRTTTKRRILSRISEKNRASYVGVLRHARAFGIEKQFARICQNSGVTSA